MALTVATNTGALMAQAAASSVNKEMELSMERLSTGKRINGASDDAAGVAIASRLTAEIKGTNQAIRNAMDGQALIDTAEGAHQEIETILQRMRELAVQAANGTNDASDRSNLQTEMDQLRTEIDRIAQTTSWAGQNLMDGSAAGAATAHSDEATFTFQVGSGTSANDSISAHIGAVTADALGVGGVTSTPTLVEITDNASGDGAIAIVDNVLTVTATDATDWDANDTIGITVNGQSVNITLADNDGYDDSVSGVASQIKAAVEAQGISGVSITQSAGVLTFNAGAAVEVPVITTSTTASNSTAVIKAHTGDAVIFSGDFNAGDVFTMDINGSTVSITASTSDAYADSMDGLAAQLADEITAAVATSGKGDLGGNETNDFNQGLSAVASGASVDLTQALILTNASMETSGSATISSGTDAVVNIGGANAASDTFALTVNGEDFSVEISGAATTNGYAETAAGAAAYMATTINASGDNVGVTAVASAGEVTITKNLVIDNLQSTSSSAPVIAASGSEGVYVVSGTFANGDDITMDIDGTDVTITVANDGFANTATGIANQLAQAVRDADIQGVTVTDANVNDAKFAVTKVGSLDVSSTSAAQLSVEYIDAAIQTLNSQRADLGSISNRLDSTVSNLTNISSNLQAGRGRIEDADFAAETTSLAKSQILQQASTAMLAQANASKQNVLSLLQG
jgi:flagellin